MPDHRDAIERTIRLDGGSTVHGFKYDQKYLETVTGLAAGSSKTFGSQLSDEAIAAILRIETEATELIKDNLLNFEKPSLREEIALHNLGRIAALRDCGFELDPEA